MKCGEKCEKWGKNHRCPEKISLHVLEELLEAIQLDSVTDSAVEDTNDEEEVFTLSSFAVVGVQGRKTIKLTGLVNNQEILILVDSRSSCTFISEKAAASLKCDITSSGTSNCYCSQWSATHNQQAGVQLHLVVSGAHIHTCC